MMTDVYFIVDKHNRNIRLVVEDLEITAFHNDVNIGGIIFSEIELGDICIIKVVNMYLDKVEGYTSCGIGSGIIKLAYEYWGWKIAFGNDDGTTSEDGSHLTGDGPSFVASLNKNFGGLLV